MRRIPLTNAPSQYTLVDDADYRWLRQWPMRLDNRGYAVVIFGKKSVVPLHQMLCPLPPGSRRKCVDHRSRDRLDNRRSNLRLASRRQNSANSSPRKGRRFQYTGVRPTPNGKRWVARIGAGGTHLGSFATEIQAAQARDRAAIRLYGEFARLNCPTRRRGRSNRTT